MRIAGSATAMAFTKAATKDHARKDITLSTLVKVALSDTD